jgi:hypothetical protein
MACEQHGNPERGLRSGQRSVTDEAAQRNVSNRNMPQTFGLHKQGRRLSKRAWRVPLASKL